MLSCGNITRLTKSGFIHGDLKPGNILIFEDDQGLLIAKLADFGFSLQSTDMAIKLPVSQGWNAPEVSGSFPDFTLEQAMKADIFSLGLILVWLMSRLSDKDRPREPAGPETMDRSCTNTSWSVFARDIQENEISAKIVSRTIQRLQASLGEEITGRLGSALKLMLSVQPEQRTGRCDEILRALKWIP